MKEVGIGWELLPDYWSKTMLRFLSKHANLDSLDHQKKKIFYSLAVKPVCHLIAVMHINPFDQSNRWTNLYIKLKQTKIIYKIYNFFISSSVPAAEHHWAPGYQQQHHTALDAASGIHTCGIVTQPSTAPQRSDSRLPPVLHDQEDDRRSNSEGLL